MLRRINLLHYFDLVADIDDAAKDPIIASTIEHVLVDLGYIVVLTTPDIRMYISDTLKEMITVITSVVTQATLNMSVESQHVRVYRRTPYIYDVILDKSVSGDE